MNALLARRTAAAAVAAGLLSTLAAAQPVDPAPPPDFHASEPDLRAYVTAALERNPTILESEARSSAARLRVPQVTALPDPVLTFTQALRAVETRVGPQLNSVTLTQAFPWFGTLDLRGRVALQEATALHHLHAADQRDVIAEVKEAYYELGYTDAALRIARQERLLLEHYETLANGRYAAGQGLQQEVIRLQAEIARVVNRRHGLEQQRAALAARLNTLRSHPATDPLPEIAPLAWPAVDLEREQLNRLGEQHRQELQAAGALIRGSRHAIDLARKSARPGFSASVGVTNVGRHGDLTGLYLLPPDNGKNALTLSLGVSLPVWRDKYRAAAAQAADELRAHEQRRAAARDAMELAVQDALVRLEALERQVDLLDTVLIPQTDETLRATEAAYETGQLGVLDLLDSERTLLDMRLMRARYGSDFLIALARLERAVGTRVPRG